MTSSYLGGGTALALQIGHRKSDDLYFFVAEDFSVSSFKNNIQTAGLEALFTHQTPDHTELMILSIKVDFIKEQVPLQFPLKPIDPQTENLMMADLRDIGQMKIHSIGTIGSKKDFVDLYCLTREMITLESIIAMAMEEDRGVSYSKLLFLKGLVDFEEADQEPDSRMIWDISWEEVKSGLVKEVKEIALDITAPA
ncbi:nucleotidyl transferase AbiEii/AbiGii toxin family protein [Thermodesulfobacteriota bacterium]